MIRVLLWKAPKSDLIGAVIRAWTKSEYTHSGLVLEGEVWEYTRWGFRRSPLESYPGDYELWGFQGMTQEQESLMLKQMADISRLPGRYDWSALLGLSVDAIVQVLFGRDCKSYPQVNPFHHPERFFCSEFVAAVAAAAGFNHQKPPGLVYPADHAKVPWIERVG